MEPQTIIQILEVVGRIAGIGGLSLGVLLLVFRAVIYKNIFPTLTQEQAYKTLNRIITLVTIVAMTGIGTWLASEVMRNSDTVSKSPTSEISQSKARINAFPEDKLELEDIFTGVKEVLIFEEGHQGEQRIKFSIRGIDKPAELLFDPIAPNYPFAIAVRFPDYRRTAYLDVIAWVPQAFQDGKAKQDWRIHATIYDIDNDGIPEALVALNRWKEDFWDVTSSVTLLVYTFHPPTNMADLDRSENWALAGKASGQQLVLLDEDNVIMPIGSRNGYLYLLKDDILIQASGVVRDNNGRYRPYQY